MAYKGGEKVGAAPKEKESLWDPDIMSRSFPQHPREGTIPLNKRDSPPEGM